MSLELAYTEHGGGNRGVPLVLAHAFPLPGVMFDALAARLAGERRVIVPDLRGFGGSPGPGPGQPSLDAMADDVAALLDRLGVAKAAMAGVSMGGYLVMALLRRHPERVAAAILIDTKAGKDTAEARENRERVARAVLDVGSRALRPMLDTLLGETTRRERPQVVEQVAAWLDVARPDGVAWAQRAMSARPASFDTLAAADVPVAVVVGSEDGVTPPADAEAMAKALDPPAPVHVIEGASHLSPLEDPDAVAVVVREALARVRLNA